MANNIRINLESGETDFYYPLEITDDSVLNYAKVHGLEIGIARIGYRRFKAVFVPCKDQTTDLHGNIIFVNTPSEIQRQRYLNYIKDELCAQDAAKHDGRCNIPDGRGGLKRCPLRVSNPEYTPGGSEPKTLPVRCEGCRNEPYRQAHTVIQVSALDHENDAGEVEPYEIPAPATYYGGDQFERLADQFVAFVQQHDEKLVDLADLMTQEYTRSEAARELGIPVSTAGSQLKKLKKLAKDFLDEMITL